MEYDVCDLYVNTYVEELLNMKIKGSGWQALTFIWKELHAITEAKTTRTPNMLHLLFQYQHGHN